MKEHDYKKVLGKNNPVQNAMALALLIEHGRTNILNDDYYNNINKNLEENPNSLMTPDFQKEVIKITRDMAKMSSNDLYDFIKNEVHVVRKNDKER